MTGTGLDRIVVVGASLAGFHAVKTLRKEGFVGSLIVVGDEPHRPYDRPPLSKRFLAGGDDSVLDLPGSADLDQLDLQWRLGHAATLLDTGARRVGLADGTIVDYDGLLITTGGVTRSLPGADLGGVHVLRTRDDSLALRCDLDLGPNRVVVIGAGFIGAEVASTCRARGLDVTLLDSADIPMGHAVGPEIGNVLADLHRENGVDLRLGVGVQRLVEADGRVSAVVLSDGSTIDADVVVVGIGVAPATEWLVGSGLTIDNGVVCDETCLAAPGVVAAGDVARWPNPTFDGELMRVEHWENAVSMATFAAKRLLAGSDWSGGPYATVPWFWSDQYDRKIQLAGRVASDDEVRLIDGSYEERRFAVLYGRAGRLRGVLAMNRPKLVMQYRSRIEAGMGFDEAVALADG